MALFAKQAVNRDKNSLNPDRNETGKTGENGRKNSREKINNARKKYHKYGSFCERTDIIRRMKISTIEQENTPTVETIQHLLSMVSQQEITNKQLEEKVQTLEHQLAWFKKQLFGQKSERRDYLDHPFQTTIADVLGEAALPQPPDDEPKKTITYQRGKAKKNALDGSPEDSGLRFDDSVPVEEIHLSAPELDGEHKDDYEIIAYKTTYRLAQNPSSYVVLKYIRPVVKHTVEETLITPTAPTNVLDKSVADVSFLVGLLIDKFLYHLPLHRQHQRLTNNGIVLARSTLTNLVKRAIELLRPIYQAQLAHILLSRILAIDETYIKAGNLNPGKLLQAYFWPIYGEDHEVCFTFSQTRGASHLKTVLKDYTGTLLSDGYKAYECYANRLAELTHALCWVHSRRGFIDAETSEPDAVAMALDMIGQLYAIEKTITADKLDGKRKLAYRQAHSQPVVDQFFRWCHEQRQRPDLLPSNPFSKALQYVQKREHGLRVFLTDADVPLDTNHLERALRCVPMGRRNWLFCWTEIGAEHVGIIQSLITTCRLHDVNPYDYLIDVLQRVSEHPANRVHELTPREWKTHFAQDPLRSDLYKRNYGIL